MGSMFGNGFNAKDIGVYVQYLKEIFQMLIDLLKSLGNKADPTTAPASEAAPAAEEGAGE